MLFTSPECLGSHCAKLRSCRGAGKRSSDSTTCVLQARPWRTASLQALHTCATVQMVRGSVLSAGCSRQMTKPCGQRPAASCKHSYDTKATAAAKLHHVPAALRPAWLHACTCCVSSCNTADPCLVALVESHVSRPIQSKQTPGFHDASAAAVAVAAHLLLLHVSVLLPVRMQRLMQSNLSNPVVCVCHRATVTPCLRDSASDPLSKHLQGL
jgi:hypothetical protein